MGDWVEPGQPAPNFDLLTGEGSRRRLADFAGAPLVLYFYPRDDTSGCTKEACAFRDAAAELAARGARVAGVSPDDVESHARFRDKHGLDFPLLADPDHAVAEAYGAWRERNQYGRKFFGIQRSTFLIDADGTIARVWRQVRVDGHVDHVLKAIDALR